MGNRQWAIIETFLAASDPLLFANCMLKKGQSAKIKECAADFLVKWEK